MAEGKKSGGGWLAWLLVVARGRSFPTGTRNIGAQDGEFGKVYAPLTLPKDAKIIEGEFDDRSQLDRALFEQLLPLAKAAAGRPDAASQADAMHLADRASQLAGLTARQHDELQGLRGDLAYSAALGQLSQLGGQIDEARRLLDQSRERGSRHSAEAALLSAELKTVKDRLADVAAGRAPAIAAPPVPAPPAPSPASDAGSPDAGARDGGR